MWSFLCELLSEFIAFWNIKFYSYSKTKKEFFRVAVYKFLRGCSIWFATHNILRGIIVQS
jgi:hypothetical protein